MRQLIGVLALCVGLAGASAAPAQERGTRIALIIANANYAAAGRLTNPLHDAQMVAAAAQRAGFATTIVNDANLDAFQQALRAFGASANGAEAAMVYYAGHGIEGRGQNWLIPVDALLDNENTLALEAVSLDQVVAAIGGARWRIIVLDACRNNPFGRTWRSSTRAVTRGLAAVQDVDDMLVLYAAAPGQTATDGAGGNSPFALSLARRLVEPGLPIQLLGNNVRDDVLRSTNGAQRPFLSASMSARLYYLVPTSVETAVMAPTGGSPSSLTTSRPLTSSGTQASAVVDVEAYNLVGLIVRPLTSEERGRYDLESYDGGVLVTRVQENSDLFDKGVRPGFLILEAGGRRVRTTDELETAVTNAGRRGRLVLIHVLGPSGRAFISTPIPTR